MEEKLLRNYEVRESTYKWLESYAKREGRAIVRQVEKIIEDARKKDQK